MGEVDAKVAVAMVSLNCKGVLRDCLDSLRTLDPPIPLELILVDNASTDGTLEMVRADYPELAVIENDGNKGFSIATNQGVEATTAPYVLLLNTDTIVEPDSISTLVQFLEDNPKAAAVGPKVLNGDGSFQPQCRRGKPTPLASLLYLLKFHKLFPDKPWANGYLLGHLPLDQSAQVDAISGCCLLTRRDIWKEIGELDPGIFGYGEDIDWCLRAKEHGYEVWYYPQSVITHLKGQGGAHSKPYHKIWGIHQAMWVVYRKHFRKGIFTTALVIGGIAGSFALACVLTTVKRIVKPPRRAPA